MAGIKNDQVALYIKDMYKAEREGVKEVEMKHSLLLKVKNNLIGSGDKITQILGAGSLRRHTVENQNIIFKSPVQGWEFLVNYWMYSDGIALSKPAVEDTTKLGNLLKDLANTWGKQVRIAKEELAARIFNEGGNLLGDWVFNGTHTGNTSRYGDMMYDNKPMFNLVGNPRYRKQETTGFYNSVAGLTVCPADFETLYNLHTATNNRDERENIVRNPCDTILVRPGANRFLAERLIMSEKLAGGELNDINPYYKLVSIVDWDYLEAAEASFYLLKRQTEEAQFHERQASEIRFFRNEDNLGYKTSINIRIGILLKGWSWISRAGGTSA